MPILIDHKRCKGCVLCVDACPRHLISQGRELNDQGYMFVVCPDPKGECNACSLCAVMCPDICIGVYRGEKAPPMGKTAEKAPEKAPVNTPAKPMPLKKAGRR
jgi:2-oxoglutarate ferredoxin oxidoreductase subunit delta